MMPVTLITVAKHFFADRSTQVYGLLLVITLGVYTVAALDVTLGFVAAEPPPSYWVAIAWCALGWFLYLLQEYVAHVWIFHMPPPKTPERYRLLYRLHMGRS